MTVMIKFEMTEKRKLTASSWKRSQGIYQISCEILDGKFDDMNGRDSASDGQFLDRMI